MVSNSSSGGGGGRSSKKPKQKKIPQRGLGVEKLEKIRLEEQKKIGSSVHRPLPSLIPFPQPSPIDPCSSSVFRPSSSVPIPISNQELFCPPPPLPYGHNFVNPIGGGGDGTAIGWSTSNVGGHGYFPSMWNSQELNHNGESTKLDTEFAVGSNSQSDSKLNLSPLVVMQGKQHYQQFPSMVTVPSSLSSGLNLQMEPPSNQSFYSNYPTPLWSSEKMVGVKRQWPFALDNQLGPSFPCKFPHFYRSGETSLCGNGNGGMFNFERGNVVFSEGHADSTALHINGMGSSPELNPKKSIKENGALDGDFLTLGLPATSSCSTTSKFKQPLAFLPSIYQEQAEFNVPPYQGNIEDPLIRRDGSVQHQPCYSFFPPNGQQNGRLGTTTNDRVSETVDGVNLTLKL